MIMDDQAILDKVGDLMAEFDKKPDSRQKKALKQFQSFKSTKLMNEIEIEKALYENLDYLRVCIKYQAFDLEATRRENKYLKKLLEEEAK